MKQNPCPASRLRIPSVAPVPNCPPNSPTAFSSILRINAAASRGCRSPCSKPPISLTV